MPSQLVTSPGAVKAALAASACLLLALDALCSRPETAKQDTATWAAYATDLSGRTPNQRFNAARAARAIDGVTVAPGQIFSFNRTVRGWSADQGFRKAPVSYDGVLVDDYGGGVCQTSTTLYNAALLAGLPILERHAHTFAPSYAPPGRDAAVAYAGVDLRFRNTSSVPLVIHARVEGRMLVCRLVGRGPLSTYVVIRAEGLDRFAPLPARIAPGTGLTRARWHRAGRDGVRVAIFRDTSAPGRVVRHESISDDTYRPISRVEWAVR